MKKKHKNFFIERFSFLSGYSAFLIVLIFFRASLDYSYVVFVSPFYEESFLKFPLEVNLSQYVISWLILFLFLVLFLKHKLARFSDYFFLSATVFLITPLSSSFGLDGNKSIYPVLVTTGSLYIIFFIVRLKKGLSKPLYVKNGRKKIIYLSWFLIIYLLSWYFVSGAMGNMNFNLSKVYEFREINSHTVDLGILSYLNIWTYKIFINFLVAYYLYQKKFGIVVVLLTIQLVFFGVTAHKAILFIPLLTISMWFYIRKTDRLIIVPLLFSSTILISSFMYTFFDQSVFSEMFVRRVFFVPSALTWEWFDFFSNNPHVYWSDKLLSSFIKYPYTLNIPHTVGGHLLRDELAANNGYVSSAFAHANLYGVVFYSLVLGFIVRFLDSLSSAGIPLWLTIAVCLEPLRTALTASDLLTSILSHGIIISIIILIFFRSNKLYG